MNGLYHLTARYQLCERESNVLNPAVSTTSEAGIIHLNLSNVNIHRSGVETRTVWITPQPGTSCVREKAMSEIRQYPQQARLV